MTAFLSGVFMGAGQAAEKIRYEEIPHHIARFGTVLEHRGFTVTTIDGKKHAGRTLRLEADHVELLHGAGPGEKVPADQISRIEIRKTGRYSHHITDSAVIPIMVGELVCMDGRIGCIVSITVLTLPITAVLSPVWAYTAVTAPFYLVADAIAFFLPPKVFEIEH